MTAIIIPGNSRRPPKGRVTVDDYWLDFGLTHLISPDVPDLRVSMPIAGANFGPAFDGGTGAYIDLGPQPSLPANFATVLQVVEGGFTGSGFSFSSRSTFSTSGIEFLINFAAVTGRFSFRGSTDNRIATIETDGASKPRVLCGRILGNSLAMAVDRAESELTTTSADPANWSGSQNMLLHRRGSTEYLSKTGLFAFFAHPSATKRIYGADANHQALMDNPYVLYKADPIRIYSLPSGPISISWSSLTASGITPTTATLTLGGITR